MVESLAKILKNIRTSISTLTANIENIVSSINALSDILGVSSGLNSDGSLDNTTVPGTETSNGATLDTNPNVLHKKIKALETEVAAIKDDLVKLSANS